MTTASDSVHAVVSGGRACACACEDKLSARETHGTIGDTMSFRRRAAAVDATCDATFPSLSGLHLNIDHGVPTCAGQESEYECCVGDKRSSHAVGETSNLNVLVNLVESGQVRLWSGNDGTVHLRDRNHTSRTQSERHAWQCLGFRKYDSKTFSWQWADVNMPLPDEIARLVKSSSRTAGIGVDRNTQVEAGTNNIQQRLKDNTETFFKDGKQVLELVAQPANGVMRYAATRVSNGGVDPYDVRTGLKNIGFQFDWNARLWTVDNAKAEVIESWIQETIETERERARERAREIERQRHETLERLRTIHKHLRASSDALTEEDMAFYKENCAKFRYPSLYELDQERRAQELRVRMRSYLERLQEDSDALTDDERTFYEANRARFEIALGVVYPSWQTLRARDLRGRMQGYLQRMREDPDSLTEKEKDDYEAWRVSDLLKSMHFPSAKDVHDAFYARILKTVEGGGELSDSEKRFLTTMRDMDLAEAIRTVKMELEEAKVNERLRRHPAMSTAKGEQVHETWTWHLIKYVLDAADRGRDKILEEMGKAETEAGDLADDGDSADAGKVVKLYYTLKSPIGEFRLFVRNQPAQLHTPTWTLTALDSAHKVVVHNALEGRGYKSMLVRDGKTLVIAFNAIVSHLIKSGYTNLENDVRNWSLVPVLPAESLPPDEADEAGDADEQT